VEEFEEICRGFGWIGVGNFGGESCGEITRFCIENCFRQTQRSSFSFITCFQKMTGNLMKLEREFEASRTSYFDSPFIKNLRKLLASYSMS
jgi:hypothetical protein